VGLQVLARGATVELSTSSGERVAIGPGPYGDTVLLRAVAAIESTPPPAARVRGARRRPPAPGPSPVSHGFTSYGGAPLVITTKVGADTLPASLGFGHLIVAA
jgi:hypothetical protein